MANLIIASFHQEAAAMEASQKLHDLESIGDITIYELVILQKNETGETKVLQADTTEGATTLSGMAIGTLIGALAGPVGMAVGMLGGTLTGAAVESDDYGFAEDFIAGAADQLRPGMTAIVAEVDEDDPVFIDSSLAPLEGTVTRSNVDYEYTKYSDEEIDELDEEIADTRAKLKAAAAEKKDKFQQKIDKLKEKRKDRIAELKDKVKEAVSDIKTTARERKIQKLRNKIEKHHKKIAQLEKDLQAVVALSPEQAKESPAMVK
jgi:uncharacterized membrane protein